MLDEYTICFVSHTALLIMHCRGIDFDSITLNLEFSLLIGRWGTEEEKWLFACILCLAFPC